MQCLELLLIQQQMRQQVTWYNMREIRDLKGQVQSREAVAELHNTAQETVQSNVSPMTNLFS